MHVGMMGQRPGADPAAVATALGTAEGAAAVAGAARGRLASVSLMDPLFGATGDGVADDQPAFLAARDYLAGLGGGRLLVPNKTFLLASSEASHFGVPYCVDWLPGHDNITIEGEGPTSILKVGLNARMFAVNVGGYAAWEATPVRAVTGSIAKGSRTITLASGLGAHFAAGDWIEILTGNCTGLVSVPDAEINRVLSVSGDVLTLFWATAAPYVQEYYIADPVASPSACGPSTTSVTAWPAPFGVRNVNTTIMGGPKFRNLRIESAYDHTLIAGGYTHGFEIADCDIRCVGTIQSMNAQHGARMVRNRCFQDTAQSSINPCYGFSLAMGSVDCEISGNLMEATGACEMIHIHEGVKRSRVEGNDIRTLASQSVNAPIDVRARAYDLTIARNRLRGTAISPIRVDETVIGGGAILENEIYEETSAPSIAVLGAAGMRVAGNRTGIGKLSIAPGNTAEDVESLWIGQGQLVAISDSPVRAAVGSYGVAWKLGPDADMAVGTVLRVPDGWAGVQLSFVYGMAATGSGNMQIRTRVATFGTTAQSVTGRTVIIASDQAFALTTGAASALANLSTTGTLGASARYLEIYFGRMGTNAADTDTRDLYLYAVILRRVS